VALTMPVAVGFAGKAAIFALVLTLIATAALTNTFAEFAKRIPSAGSLFAWNSAGLGSNFGFVFGWFYVGCYVLAAMQGYPVFGGFLHEYLLENLSISVPWWILAFACLLMVVFFSWRGISLSVKAAFAVLGAEVLVLIALSVSLLISGQAHLSLDVLNPSNSPDGWAGIGLAVSFGIVGLAGFEEAATLGEEATDPRRSVGRGLFMSIIVFLGVLIFVEWVIIGGYPGGVTKLGENPNAVQAVATEVWHGFGGIVTVVIISSVFGFTLTAFNAGVRVLYSLSHVRVMPHALGTTNRHGTPGSSIIVFAAVTGGLGIGAAAFTGPLGIFAYVGLLIAITFSVIYISTNVALVNFIRKTNISELSLVRHILLPLVAVVGVGYALYRSISPLPPPPVGYMPWVVLAWIVAGVGLLTYLRRTRGAQVEDIAQAFAAEWDPEEVTE
jgi:amino acid transporter